jgi:steroid 5-alpha reductase family enzyme
MNTIFSQALWQGLLFAAAVNLLFFLLALWKQSDHFTDITYSLTFMALALFYFLKLPAAGTVPLLALLLVYVWAVRLGSYLLLRIFWMGKDARFDKMRGVPLRFLSFWLLQALTVWVVLLPLYAFLRAPLHVEFSWMTALGLLLWALGLAIETTADMQKFTFKARVPEGRWVDRGLWKNARHPNFFGEMLVWWGFFLVALPSGWPLLATAVAGPLFISLMLRFVSGVPLLEKSATGKYGHLPEYGEHLKNTRLLFPWPKRRS